MNLRSEKGYEYTSLSPEEYSMAPTRIALGIGTYSMVCGLIPDERWADIEAQLLSLLPKLEGFQREGDYRVSVGRLPAGEILATLEKIPHRGGSDDLDLIDRLGNLSEVRFWDLRAQAPYTGLPWQLPRIRLDDDIMERTFVERPYQDRFTFDVDRSGHDGVANGGSWGRYWKIFTDGAIKKSIRSDRSTRQYGHRLNYHHDDYSVLVEVVGGTWVVIDSWRPSQMYDYPSYIEYYGPAPANWRRYQGEVV
jgi:hypothetical protein